jgi:uncharacterized protein (TIGR02996 family)
MGKTAKAKASRVVEPTPAEEQPFLDEIIAAPDDDAPRLILADWLEERGDPRAEFIRVQCRLAKMTGDEAAYDALEDREAELLAVHGSQWLKRQPALPGIAYGAVGYLRDFSLCEHDSDRVHFVRGTVELATVKMFSDFRKQTPALAERTVIRELRFSQLALREFSLLLKSDFVPRLKGLLLTTTALDAEGAEELAQSSLVANLETLSLKECLIGDEDLAALLPKLKRVKRLCLAGSNFLDGVELVAKWKGLKNVQALQIDLDDDSFATALAKSPNLGGLRTLGAGGFVSDNALKALAGAKGLKRLRSLSLSHAIGLKKSTVESLAGLTQLRRLSLHWAEIGDAVALTLAELSGLRRLDLRKTNVTAKAVNALNKSLPACKILSDFTR